MEDTHHELHGILVTITSREQFGSSRTRSQVRLQISDADAPHFATSGRYQAKWSAGVCDNTKAISDHIVPERYKRSPSTHLSLVL